MCHAISAWQLREQPLRGKNLPRRHATMTQAGMFRRPPGIHSPETPLLAPQAGRANAHPRMPRGREPGGTAGRGYARPLYPENRVPVPLIETLPGWV